MSNPELALSNQVCFRVYSLDRAFQAAYRGCWERWESRIRSTWP
jgi:hypothetical protein